MAALEKDPSASDRAVRRTAPSGSPPAGDEDLRRALRSHVARYCPRWMRDHVEDLVQIAWLRLDAARNANEENRVPGTSLIARVAFCATMDESRRLRRRREVPMDPAPDPMSPTTEEPSRAAQGAEIRRALGECLTSMRENRSLAVTLYLQGHTAPETGRLLGWSTSKVESLIFRGLADLRRCLAAKGHTP